MKMIDALVSKNILSNLLIIGSHYLKQSELPFKVESAIEKKLDEYLKEEKK